MQEHTRASPRLLAAAAIALVVAAIVAFSWLSGSSVAGAAGTGGSSPSAQFEPVQSEGYSAPGDARGARDGRDCPEHQQGGGDGQSSGGSDQPAAPSASTPSTEL